MLGIARRQQREGKVQAAIFPRHAGDVRYHRLTLAFKSLPIQSHQHSRDISIVLSLGHLEENPTASNVPCSLVVRGSNSSRSFDMSASLPKDLSVQSVLTQEAEPREIAFLPCLGTIGSPDVIPVIVQNSRVRRQLLSLTRLR